jgi:hypothetical protein
MHPQFFHNQGCTPIYSCLHNKDHQARCSGSSKGHWSTEDRHHPQCYCSFLYTAQPHKSCCIAHNCLQQGRIV